MNTPRRLWRGYTLRRLAHNNLYPQHIHFISSATERRNFKFAGAGLFKHETGLVWRLMCIKYLLYKSRENLICSKFYMAENCSRSTWPSSCATSSAFPSGPIQPILLWTWSPWPSSCATSSFFQEGGVLNSRPDSMAGFTMWASAHRPPLLRIIVSQSLVMVTVSPGLPPLRGPRRSSLLGKERSEDKGSEGKLGRERGKGNNPWRVKVFNLFTPFCEQ